MFKRILIAFDTGESSRQAVSVGMLLARENRAEVALVFVAAPPVGYLSDAAFSAQRVFDEQHDRARRLFDEVRAGAPDWMEIFEFMPEGDAAREIVVVAKRWRADLIVVGTHGAGRLESFLLGSTAQSVIHQALRPVLVVRQGVVTEEDADVAASGDAEEVAPCNAIQPMTC